MSNERRPLSEAELDCLSALADGELETTEAMHWKQRIAAEPATAEAYARILSIKKSLGTLSLADGQNNAMDHLPDTLPKGKARALMAAAVAAVLVLGGAWLSWQAYPPSQPHGLMAWHEHLSAGEYVVGTGLAPLFISLGPETDISVPDLTPSRLYLVDTRIIEEAGPHRRAVLHYRGLRGCRLTIWTGRSGTHDAENLADLRRWTVGTTQFGIVATGMDPARFSSIADYVETVTRRSENQSQDTRTAMGRAYGRTKSCA